MKSITTIVAIVLLINLVRADVPDLPQQFTSNVQATLPFMGTLPGVLYYDYPNLKQRLEMSQWGQNMIFIYRYDLGVEYQIMGGQCQSQPLTDELYPMSIPPFATYSGTRTVNNTLTYVYTADLFGQVIINYFVTNTTTDYKETWTIVRFDADVAGITIQYDYSNLVAGPQDPSLFDYTKYNCPSPTPPVVYSVSGYVKSATTNGVLLGMTVKLDSASTTTDSNGQYTFSGVPPGVHTVSVPDNAKYYGDSLTLNVTGDIPAGTSGDFSLSPVLQSGQWRAVLTWGAFPTDLDSYFITSYNCKVYYGNGYCQSGNAVAQLDVDDRNGYGPETITMNSVSGCYIVNNYSKNGYFPQSNARVQIFNSQGLQKDIRVDTTGYNANALNWKVFCLDISQSNPLTIVNSYY